MADDFAQSMAAWQASMAASSGGGGRQAWFEKSMNQGATSVTAAHGGGGLKLVGVIPNNSRGFFGGGGDKVAGLLARIHGEISKMSFPVQQVNSITEITGQANVGGSDGGRGMGSSFDMTT